MNKNFYKTIFSKTRGEMVVVAENVSAEGQTSNQRTTQLEIDTESTAEKSLGLKVLSFSIMLMTGVASIGITTDLAQANVVADSNAAGNQRPTIINSANGTTQVNIQTPSQAGVSMNHYQQFDVNQKGVILNNSRQNTQTQLAGHIQANPWLAGGEAKVIVNQVNSSNPSHLNGYIEVGGRKADVIIANPVGINVDGGGFINASGVTLTTANPLLNNGAVTGFQVRDGLISITGQGLDTSTADYTRLLSHAAQINAGVWAKDLQIVTGQNDINAENNIKHAGTTSGSTTPKFAIDTGSLGGMYAGKISLISTDKGVGINNAGQIFASAGSIKISADGQLQNSAQIVAEQKTSSTPAQLELQVKDLNNTGELLSLGDQRIQAEKINNTGLINSQGLTRIDASQSIQNIGTGQIYGDHIALQTAYLLNAEQQTNEGMKAGTIAARQRLDLAGGKIENREQALIASEGTLVVGGQLNDQHQAEGSATALDNASARIQSVGDMYLGVDTLTNRNLHFSSSVKEIPGTRKDITAYQGDGSSEILDSSHVTGWGAQQRVYLDGREFEDYTRYIYNQHETKHYVDSSAPAEIISGGELTIKGDSLTNDKSQILAAKGINIEQNEVNNIDAEGEHRVIKKGTSQYHYVGWNTLGTSKRSKWNSIKAYNPADVVTPIKLDVVKYDGAYQGELAGDTSDLSLPLQSLYNVNKENNNKPLIETNDAFTNYKKWLGSDYMLQMFSTDPQNMHKRLGDGYYEQKLVNDQIAKLTGKVYLDGFTNYEDQFKALMDSGVSTAKDLDLSVGVKLSEAQIARLTSDIVWLVTETITVDGEKIQVLVPKVYVAVQPGDLNNKGALIAADTVNLKLTGNLNNQGNIAGRQVVNLEADNINNVGGLIQGNEVFATAQTDINNIGGQIQANKTLALDAGRDINNITTTIKTENKDGLSEFTAENIGRVAGLYVQDVDGTLTAQAKNNINLTASDIQSQGSASVKAGQDLNLSAVNVSRSDLSSAGEKDQILNASSRDVGTQIQAKGDIQLQSGANTQIKAATLNSETGNVVIDAGQNVLIENGRDERTSKLAAQEKGGFSKTEKQIQSNTSQSLATNIQAGGNVLINSQQGDIQATHLIAEAQESIQISANKGNVKLLSDIDTDMKSKVSEKKNAVQFKNRQSGYINEEVAQTQLKAGKNVDINAGKNIELQANDIQAKDNIYIGNTQFERQADGSLTSKDGNALPENVSLTTLETNDQQWDETQKGYRGIAKDLMKATAIGLAGIEGLAPGLKAPKITIGESSSTRTEQRTQTGTDLSGNNVYVGSAGQTTLTSSNIDAENTVLAGQKVTLDAAEEQQKTVSSSSKETVQGLGAKLNKDSIRVGGFVLEDTEHETTTTATTHKSGNINTNNLTIQGTEGVDILGQNITASGDTVIDHGRGNLNIGGYENKTTTTEKTHTETVSTEVGIRNAYVDAVLAVAAVADATKALSKAKDDYSQAQRDYASGKITKEALDDSKANIAMATANVASAQIAVGAAMATAAASSATYGFTIGANGERIETTSTTNTEQSQWQGSNLDLNNLQFKSEGQDVNIQGSRVNASGTTVFDGTKDLNVTAGVERSKQDSNSKTNSQSVSYTYGGGGSASIGKQTSKSQSESLTHVNSDVTLNRTEGAIDQLNIKGGTVSIADRGNLQVNGIHVESLQDTASSSNSSKGSSIGGGYGGDSKNITASYNQGKGNSDSAWVNDTSKLLIGDAQNDADLDAMGVKKVTNVGGVIANATENADGTLTDHGKLNYSGELELKDVEDHNYNSSSGFNVSTNIGISQKGTKEASTAPKGSTTVGLNSSGQETEQLTKATMGQGTVANATDGSNRDINNTQEITRDQTTGMLDGSVTVDHRLLTESGRKEIIQQQKDLPENFRQSAENLVQALPDGEYKDNALKALNNIQASLVNNPEMLINGGNEVYEGYKEFIRKGGEPEQYEALLNKDVLPLAKELNNLGKQAQDEIKQELTKYYGLDDEQAAKVAKTVLLTRESYKNNSVSNNVDDFEPCTGCLHLEIVKSAPIGSQVLLSNAPTYKITLDNGKDIYFETGSNLAIGIFNKSADISYKITEAIQKTGIDSQTAGMALSLAFGGPIGLAKDLIKDAVYGQEVAALEDAAKNQVTAIVRESDRDAVSQLTSNGLNNSTDPLVQQAVDEVQKTKDGVGFLSSIIFGGVGGTAVGKSNTTKIDGKDVETSTAGIGNRGELTKPYDPNQTRNDLEAVYGKENVKSTTVPSKPHQASATRSDVVMDVNGGKAVQVRLEDGSIKMIAYDKRGLAIFDDVVVFTTKIDESKSYSGQMSQASKDMWNVIKDDPVAQSKLTSKQLKALEAGRARVPGYTWHHNAQSSPNNMQLVPDTIHSNKAVPHTGQNSLTNSDK